MACVVQRGKLKRQLSRCINRVMAGSEGCSLFSQRNHEKDKISTL